MTTSQDVAGTGITGQRVDQVSDDVYGEKTLDSYLNAAAFAMPARRHAGQPCAETASKDPGSGRSTCRSRGSCQLAAAQTLELRIETFNLFNTFNWGNPVTNFNSGTFGRILTQSGDPRIMQFGVNMVLGKLWLLTRGRFDEACRSATVPSRRR